MAIGPFVPVKEGEPDNRLPFGLSGSVLGSALLLEDKSLEAEPVVTARDLVKPDWKVPNPEPGA
jgi:hypothetical protein